MRYSEKIQQHIEASMKGEALAFFKYQIYAAKARKEGYNKIAEVFEETARNEKAHAKIWFKLLNDGVPDTKTNLLDAISGEDYEYEDMYATFAKDAREEGHEELAYLFEEVGRIEKEHSTRYKELLDKIDTLFEKDEVVTWRCMNCGHEHTSNAAPGVCPVCDHPKAHFEIKSDVF